MEETRVSHCDTCGAEVQFDPNIHSAECPFCASPVVADTGAHRHIKPQALLPFKLGQSEAQGKMRDWLKGLWFAPNGLAKYARDTGKLNGLYLPYWAFDADTQTRYTGQRGTHYYVTVGSGKNKRTERRTRWTPASGRVARAFTDVLVVASDSLPRKNLRALEPWTLSELTPYTADYLSGFRAEGYTVDLGPGYEIGKERMADVIRADIRRDIGGDEQRIGSVATDYDEERFKHILLPIWMAAYRYKGKKLPLYRQRPIWPRAGRAALFRMEDRVCGNIGAGFFAATAFLCRGNGRILRGIAMILCCGEALIDMLPRENRLRRGGFRALSGWGCVQHRDRAGGGWAWRRGSSAPCRTICSGSACARR